MKATVKYAAGPPKEVKGRGERINVVFTSDDGDEIRVWGSANSALSRLKKGDTVTLKKEKGEWALDESAPTVSGSPAAAPSAPRGPFTKPEKEEWEEMKEFGDFIGTIWLANYKGMKEKVDKIRTKAQQDGLPSFVDELDAEALERVATSITISTIRRYRID